MRPTRRFRPSPALVVALIALVAAVGGFAVAAVPDKQGRIEACYVKKTGAVKLLTKGTKCPRGWTLVRWNQTGPAGQPGTPGATGSPAGSLVTGNTENNTMPAGVTRWLAPSGPSQIWGIAANERNFADTLSPSTAIVARDLAVNLPGPPGAAGEFYKITLQLNQAGTALTCTINDPDTACADSEHAVTIPAGSLISLQVETSGGVVSRRVRWGWRAVTP
jgi:hypothetical protein